MAVTTTRALGFGVALIVAAALAVGGYAFRDCFRLPASDHAAIDHTAMPAEPTTAPTASTARGDVTVEPQRQQLIGVRLAPVTRETLNAEIRTTGVIRYDETRQADVNVKLDGWIRQLYVDYTGQSIRQGQPLFTLYSPDLLNAENEFILALRTRDQMQQSTIGDAREYAGRIVDAARQRFALWDLTADDVAEIEQSRRARGVITFRSPASGNVLDKQAVQGMHVTPGQTLYTVADLSVVWVEADVYEQEVAQVRVGDRAIVTLDAYPGQSFSGRAIYIYPVVEENTRTVKVRFQFENTGGRLKPGMYANVELQGAAARGLTVPANAVVDSGTDRIVFVAEGEGNFTPRPVKVGRQRGDRIQIVDGLKEGEQVATSATFFLDSESQLRAGLQNYEAPAGTAAPTATSNVTIDFRSQPDPPKTGESTFEVAVKDPSGKPVTDGEVSVLQFMPAMPTMNMPAMRNEAKLMHAGGGIYRGPAQVMMAGRWDVTVTVTKGGHPIGRKQFAMVAK
jgi:Cu(I)/Ag(I) efflux system membrane fusion protein/cobalt-zinc-cadmium efflux system membrane fusion protein